MRLTKRQSGLIQRQGEHNERSDQLFLERTMTAEMGQCG